MVVAATQAAVEAELRAPFDVGDRVYCKAWAAGSEQAFNAEVVSVRQRFPPIQVKFLSTLAGESDPIKLPAPQLAFVSADKISTEPPAAVAERARTRARTRAA